MRCTRRSAMMRSFGARSGISSLHTVRRRLRDETSSVYTHHWPPQLPIQAQHEVQASALVLQFFAEEVVQPSGFRPARPFAASFSLTRGCGPDLRFHCRPPASLSMAESFTRRGVLTSRARRRNPHEHALSLRSLKSCPQKMWTTRSTRQPDCRFAHASDDAGHLSDLHHGTTIFGWQNNEVNRTSSAGRSECSTKAWLFKGQLLSYTEP
jgi:hypothetical protein